MEKWHISLIVIGICLYSLICWLTLAHTCVSKYSSLLSKSNSTVTSEFNSDSTGAASGDKNSTTIAIDNSKNAPDKIISAFSKMDKVIDKLDSIWYSHMYARGKISKTDSVITYFIDGEIMSSQVLLGTNNWLFYKSITDSDPIADYEGTNLHSADELNYILAAALTTQEELEKQGIQFVILVAPNKENVYSDFMPKEYIKASKTRTDIMVEFLQENGVNISYPKRELLNNNNLQLYFKYDTHWNQLGAYIGVQSALAQFKIYIPNINQQTISSTPLANNYRYCGVDDLANMIRLRDLVFNDDVEYQINGTIKTYWALIEAENDKGEVSHFVNNSAKTNRTVLLVGDSFRTSMLPELQTIFTNVYVVHRSAYTSELINEVAPDYLIAEYVERYSAQIEEINTLVN